MSGEIISQNMGLPVPTAGVTGGPTYAEDVNNALNIIDAHDHTPGNGVQIGAGGLFITSDLLMNNSNLTLIRSLRFKVQSSPIPNTPPDQVCLYASGKDLYFNDADNNQIRMTANGNVAGAPGSISNLVSPATASYVAANSTFVWQSAANTPANMDLASLKLRNLNAGSFAMTVSPPNAMGSNIALTLPSLPSGQNIMTLDNAGNMSAPWNVDNVTLQVTANLLNIKALPALSVSTAQLVDGSVTSPKLASNINLPGNLATENGKALVVSNTNAASSLAMIRAAFNSAGTLIAGEGATATYNGGGAPAFYTITFSTPFADIPIVVSSYVDISAGGGGVQSVTTTGCIITAGPGYSIAFIAIGRRA